MGCRSPPRVYAFAAGGYNVRVTSDCQSSKPPCVVFYKGERRVFEISVVDLVKIAATLLSVVYAAQSGEDES